ncbi:MAG: endonuclease domain-containing protein [Bacteroidota bacterium]
MVFIVKPDNFYFGASEEIIRRARELRKRMTRPEEKMWQLLRNRQFQNLKFRRQHPIGRFIVDFYCHELKLIVEIDGSIHDTEIQKERDESRTFMFEELGLKVIRFENQMVMNDLTKVLAEIEKHMI